MKVKRIVRVRTYKKYEAGLREIIPAYLAKSLCTDTVQDILTQFRFGCHTPCSFGCVVLDDDDVVTGFCYAYLIMDAKGKRLMVDHLHAKNATMAGKLYDMLTDKMGVADVWFMTYRDPASWERLSRKFKKPMKVYGYIMRSESKEG